MSLVLNQTSRFLTAKAVRNDMIYFPVRKRRHWAPDGKLKILTAEFAEKSLQRKSRFLTAKAVRNDMGIIKNRAS
ncbi:MAG: hypothetical protein DMG92_06040 [Acidobacteria bacterium]|nr:MAG: hypothetical protein DMG92_06040 [Acidobacteriota bacterium]